MALEPLPTESPHEALPEPTAQGVWPALTAGTTYDLDPQTGGYDAADELKGPYPPADVKEGEPVITPGSHRSTADKPVEYRWPIPVPPAGYQGEPLLPPVGEPAGGTTTTPPPDPTQP